MTAAPALAELEALDRHHLDAGPAHGVDRVGVALVGDDRAGLEGDDVVAVVPLRPLGLELVTGGRDGFQLLEPEGVFDLVEERALGDLGTDAAVAVRPRPVAATPTTVNGTPAILISLSIGSAWPMSLSAMS